MATPEQRQAVIDAAAALKAALNALTPSPASYDADLPDTPNFETARAGAEGQHALRSLGVAESELTTWTGLAKGVERLLREFGVVIPKL